MKTMNKFAVLFALLVCIPGYAQRKVITIVPPPGFVRYEADFYGTYLRNLPLKRPGSPVMLYNGVEKGYQDGAYAIIDMEIGNKDLQQCADAVMRLRAEYLWHSKQYDEIHFNFTSGFKADYVKWAQGYRTKVNGNNVSWYKGADEDYSYDTFRKYMDEVFMYAGTASLSKELIPVDPADIKVGDIFIIGGHPGHAMIIVDMAVDKFGNKAILVAQSYMPAQSIHIVTNLSNKQTSPWYIINSNTKNVSFPEFHFYINQIKRFK